MPIWKEKLSFLWLSAWQFIGNVLTVFVPLFIFSLVGGGVIYAIEHNFPVLQSSFNSSSCLGFLDYSAAWFYVQTLQTTIGYGNVYCCSAFGRAASIIYTLIGVPVTVIALDAVGKLCYDSITYVYRNVVHIILMFNLKCKSNWKNKNVKPASNGSVPQPTGEKQDNDPKTKSRNDSDKDSADHELRVPIVLSVAIVGVWILLTSWFFSSLEAWTYADSVYFTLITLTTVGLGDYSPSKFKYNVVMFLFIFIGMSILSLLMQNIQDHIQAYVDGMLGRIMDKYKAALLDGSDELPDSEQFPWYMKLMISRRRQDDVLTFQENMQNRHTLGIQASVEMADRLNQVSFRIPEDSVIFKTRNQKSGTDGLLKTEDQGCQSGYIVKTVEQQTEEVIDPDYIEPDKLLNRLSDILQPLADKLNFEPAAFKCSIPIRSKYSQVCINSRRAIDIVWPNGIDPGKNKADVAFNMLDELDNAVAGLRHRYDHLKLRTTQLAKENARLNDIKELVESVSQSVSQLPATTRK